MNQLKLNVLSKNKIEKKDLNLIRGGSATASLKCGCACANASTNTNGFANRNAGGKWSSGLHNNQTVFYVDVVVTP